MKDLYTEFVEQCMKLIKEDDEYLDKKRVRENNRADVKLIALRKEIMEANCPEILERLLLHDDIRVQLYAAISCLDENVYFDKALQVLEDLTKLKRGFFRFNAEMAIKIRVTEKEKWGFKNT